MSQEQIRQLTAGGIIIFALLFLAVILVVKIFFILTLQKALKGCSPENRAMSPGLVWLLLIPFFNLIWNFFVVMNMAKSLGAEFQKRGIAAEAEPGKTIGLVYAILMACSIIPFVNWITGIGTLVCWIIYWVKIAGYSNQLASEIPTAA
jgi:hypothetical protein